MLGTNKYIVCVYDMCIKNGYTYSTQLMCTCVYQCVVFCTKLYTFNMYVMCTFTYTFCVQFHLSRYGTRLWRVLLKYTESVLQTCSLCVCIIVLAYVYLFSTHKVHACTFRKVHIWCVQGRKPVHIYYTLCVYLKVHAIAVSHSGTEITHETCTFLHVYDMARFRVQAIRMSLIGQQSKIRHCLTPL